MTIKSTSFFLHTRKDSEDGVPYQQRGVQVLDLLLSNFLFKHRHLLYVLIIGAKGETMEHAVHLDWKSRGEGLQAK
jgi:hypothetical protein